MTGSRIYLNCPYEEKDECKAAGGRWDAVSCRWYITEGMDLSPFSKWIVTLPNELIDAKIAKYPRATQKFNQLLERLEELRNKLSPSDITDNEAERLLWNSLHEAEEHIITAFAGLSGEAALEPEVEYALDYSTLDLEYLDPVKREELQNRIRLEEKIREEEYRAERRLEYEEQDRQEMAFAASEYQNQVLAEEGYADGLSPFSSDEYYSNDEEGWPD